jgi:CIC family chloride channel protein
VREYVVNPLARVRVEDAMERNVPVLPANTTLATIGQWLASRDPILGHRYAWPLVDQKGALAGLVTPGDLIRALERDGGKDSTVLKAGTSSLVVTYPDDAG